MSWKGKAIVTKDSIVKLFLLQALFLCDTDLVIIKWLVMATTTNVENLRQYKSRFSLIVEQILTFASSMYLENLSPNFKGIS